jgi:hypothetical protein
MAPQMAVQAGAVDPRAAPVRPALPTVTSTAGTYNANASTAASGKAADPFGAANKALRGQ